MVKLTDKHMSELEENGYVVIRDYYSGDQLRKMQAAQRRVLKTWDEIKDDPNHPKAVLKDFPHEQMELYQAMMDENVIGFFKKWYKSDKLHFRVGCMIARYPGFDMDSSSWKEHIDNGNNSLLPVSEDLREFGQGGMWVHLEDVDIDQAPLYLIPKKYGRDLSKGEPFVCKAGSGVIFTNYTWHSASTYRRKDGQRFTWGIGLGRADHYWEGFKHYTHCGTGYPVFQQFIGSLTAAQREMWRFPPAGHPYYTAQTLGLLEKQYPGWNSEEYYAAMPQELAAKR